MYLSRPGSQTALCSLPELAREANAKRLSQYEERKAKRLALGVPLEDLGPGPELLSEADLTGLSAVFVVPSRATVQQATERVGVALQLLADALDDMSKAPQAAAALSAAYLWACRHMVHTVQGLDTAEGPLTLSWAERPDEADLWTADSPLPAVLFALCMYLSEAPAETKKRCKW